MGLKKSIVFNLGSGQTSASSFSVTSDDKLVLDTFYQRTFACSGDEDEWFRKTAEAVEEATTNHKFKGDVSVILPSSKLLAKTLRVPKVEAAKQFKIVSYELTQKMPFPLQDLVWDYQVIDDDGIEQEILAFAVKKINAEQLLDLFFKNGLTPRGLYPSTILDQWALKECDEYKAHSEILLINFGARSTDLVFSGSTGFLVRNIAVGGLTLTQLLADSLGLSVEKAEEFKLSYYAGKYQGSESQMAQDKVSAAATTFMGKMGQELSRAIVNYKRLKKGKLPEVALITGQGTQMPGFVNFISECLQMPISYYNPFQGLILSKDLRASNNPALSCSISESFGLSKNRMSGNISDEKFINLLPKESLQAFEGKKKLPILFFAVLMFALCPLPFLSNNISNINRTEKEISDLRKELSEKKLVIKDLDEKKAKININKKLVDSMVKNSRDIINTEGMLYREFKLLESMEKLFRETPGGDLWLDELETITKQKNGQLFTFVKISGRYLVRLKETEKEMSKAQMMNLLIDQNTERQESLISTIKKLDIITAITKKSFSTEGKGDLFNRYFTHFHFELQL